MRKRLAAWTATVGLAAALGLVGTATPALAASCFEATCDGKALSGTDCATNQLIYDDYTLSGTVAIQLMYSPGCHAFWGEMQVSAGGQAGATLWAVPQYGGAEYGLESGISTNSALETHMWNSAGHSVKFCWGQEISPDPGDTPTAVAGCTGWR